MACFFAILSIRHDKNRAKVQLVPSCADVTNISLGVGQRLESADAQINPDLRVIGFARREGVVVLRDIPAPAVASRRPFASSMCRGGRAIRIILTDTRRDGGFIRRFRLMLPTATGGATFSVCGPVGDVGTPTHLLARLG
jgi:hypothetical protein